MPVLPSVLLPRQLNQSNPLLVMLCSIHCFGSSLAHVFVALKDDADMPEVMQRDMWHASHAHDLWLMNVAVAVGAGA
jgi:hypothetical protein